MESYCFENITYTYNGYSEPALTEVSFSVKPGEFIVVCGASGSGKSTLLRCLKERVPESGYVMQNPSTQIVTDHVYHELAFGMENKGIPRETMKHAIAETATYFGMEEWMERDTAQLSGGEKQLLNLASEIMTNPKLLLLDEPTSQLDPMAAVEFIDIVKRLNTQLGMTVILVEQRLEEVLTVCDRMMVLDNGKIAAFDRVEQVFLRICKTELAQEYLEYMPSYVRLYYHFGDGGNDCPKNVRESRRWFQENSIELPVPLKKDRPGKNPMQTVVQTRNLFFRYDKKGKDILRDVCFEAGTGHIYGIAGGNGTGKSTFLKVLAGAERAYHGKLVCDGTIAYLPQEPKYMFLEDKISDIIERQETVIKFGLSEFMERHPYDVSGGQMQRVAMAYLYEKEADLYLFDEPTKGVDPCWKQRLREWFFELALAGKTVIVVSHDVEFAANTCEYMSMCFRQEISKPVPTEEFFRDHHFYTTAIHRIVRDRYPELVSERFLYED